ncbi:MAG: alpha/beta hydrolase, partial [Phycisphaerae bacterium]|nr:alpha/beta hydrolase [Phycisphaerae bacterium]
MHQPLTPCEHQSWQMSDGYVVNGRVWPARDRAIRPAIIYLHGIQSHGAWFEWSASVLAQAGNMVVLPDRRGSGLNDEARGDTPTRNRWLDDLDDLTQQLSEEHGVTRFAVCG